VKKLLFYIHKLERAGAQRVISNLAEYFYSHEYDVLLVNDYKQGDFDDCFEVSVGIKRVFLRKSLIGNPMLKNIQRIIKLRKTIKSEKPDIVLSFMGRPNVRMLLASVGISTKKVVSVRNDPDHEYGSTKIEKRFINNLFRLAEGVIFQTKDAAMYFDLRIREKARIIINPVGEVFYSQTRNISPCGIVTFGRKVPQKNQKMLIRAYKMICDEFPGDNLFICGEGYLNGELESLCKELQIEDRVFITGNVTDVIQRLCNAKVFVLSSDYEGMPNALMEAMAIGVPSIATDCPCGGPRMLIENDSQGILIPCGDTKACSEALRQILADKELQKKMSIAAQKRAELYRAEKIYKQWEEYLLTVFNA